MLALYKLNANLCAECQYVFFFSTLVISRVVFFYLTAKFMIQIAQYIAFFFAQSTIDCQLKYKIATICSCACKITN